MSVITGIDLNKINEEERQELIGEVAGEIMSDLEFLIQHAVGKKEKEFYKNQLEAWYNSVWSESEGDLTDNHISGKELADNGITSH